jgi:chaperonin cofactor prefoldin
MLKIGSVNAQGKRNTLNTELVDRVTLIDETISYVTDRIQTIEDKISHLASKIELLLSDLKRAKRNHR